MRRPNQGHPTFPILLNPDDVPGRTLLAFVHDHFLSRWTAVFDQLEIVGRSSFAESYSHITLLLGFTLEAESTSFGLQGANLGVDVAV